MENKELIQLLNAQLNIELRVSNEQVKERLSAFINELIAHDFEKLINILYKIDVREDKLKELLAVSSGSNASEIITALIIERQLQKIKSRKQFNSRAEDCDEEKW